LQTTLEERRNTFPHASDMLPTSSQSVSFSRPHKTTSLWVNTISQQVVAVVQLAVYRKCHVICGVSQQITDQWGHVHDIKVIV